MTYLLTLVAPFGVAILADRRITFLDTGRATDSGVKTGLIDTHAIFGVSGELAPARETLRKLRSFAAERNADQWWSFARKVFEAESLSGTYGGYSITLGIRKQDGAEAWFFDSNTGLARLEKTSSQFRTFSQGSGKNFLDERLGMLTEGIGLATKAGKLPSWAVPYAFALILTTFVTGHGRILAESNGVGGAFDFVQVDALGARYQHPSLYASITIDPIRFRLYTRLRRIAAVDDLLVVEDIEPPDEPGEDGKRTTSVFWDQGRSNRSSPPEIDGAKLRTQLDEQEFYRFFGVAFDNPDLIRNFFAFSSHDELPQAISRGGGFNAGLEQQLIHMLDRYTTASKSGIVKPGRLIAYGRSPDETSTS